MKAWQFTGTHEPLVLNEVPEPTATAGHVVIEIKAAGLCHSDVGVLEVEHFLPPFVTLPITIGHEVAGVVAEVGEDVEGWAVGDRVGVLLVGDNIAGLTEDGGYASKVVVGADVLARIPDSVSYAQAAAGNDAGMTAYHAVVDAGQVKKGDKVGIIGLGGVGQVGARVAVLQGCEVYVAEIKRDIWHIADELGVTRTVSDIAELADLELDVVIDFAGFGTTTAAAIEVVRPGGRVVQVGLGKVEATFNTQTFVMKQITLQGSLGGTKEDTLAVYDLMASGELAPILTTTTFDEIPAGLDKLARGEVVGRLVAIYGD